MKNGIFIIAVLFAGAFIACSSETASIKSTSTSSSHESKANSSIQKNEASTNMIKLNSGYEMPVLGLGTWTMSNSFAAEAVYEAIKIGYRLFDTAEYYGNEKGVGEGVRRAIKEGIVKREEVFITTKVMPGNYRNPENAIDESNETLDLDYIDLMLVHQSGPNDDSVYRALVKGVKDGKIRSVGISNYYTPKEFERVTANAEIKPAIIQNENHPLYQNTELQEYVKRYGTVIESYYPLGGRGNTHKILDSKILNEIAATHNKTAAQVDLRWQIQAGYIVIPGVDSLKYLAENFDALSFTLDKTDMKKIEAMDTGKRFENW